MFCALFAGTGLRAGEALGIEIDKHISAHFLTLHIRQKVRRTKLEGFLSRMNQERSTRARLSLTRVQSVDYALQLFKLLPGLAELAFRR
jgi:hypothetical protein